jgi:hypothetical protein
MYMSLISCQNYNFLAQSRTKSRCVWVWQVDKPISMSLAIYQTYIYSFLTLEKLFFNSGRILSSIMELWVIDIFILTSLKYFYHDKSKIFYTLTWQRYFILMNQRYFLPWQNMDFLSWYVRDFFNSNKTIISYPNK